MLNSKKEILKNLATVMLKEAEESIQKNHFADAISKLTQITMMKDMDAIIATAYTHLGKIYYTKSLYDFTISMHTHAIDHGANHPDNYFQRGIAYIKQKQYTKALEDLQKSKEFGEDTPAIDINMAIAYRHLGNHKKTIEMLKDINLTHENLEPREIFIMYINFANAYLGQENFEESLKYFLKAEKLFDLDSDSYLEMAKLFKNFNNREKYNLYLDLSEKKLLSDSSDTKPIFTPAYSEEDQAIANSYFKSGISYLLEKNYKKAISFLKKSSAAGGLAERELAIAYKKSGNLERALVSYNAIINKLKNKNIAVNARHYYERAIIHLELENQKEAHKDLKTAQENKTSEDSINATELEDLINETKALQLS